MATEALNAIPHLTAKAYHNLCMAPGHYDEECFGRKYAHMGHPYTLFGLQQSEKLNKLAIAKGQMAIEALNIIPHLTAKAYHHLCMAPGHHDEEHFGW